MKNILLFRKPSSLLFLSFVLMFLLNAQVSYGQTVLVDDFTRANSTTVGNSWVEIETTGGAQISSNRLQLGSTTSGREFVYRDLSGLTTPIITDGITNNSSLITWAFNFRTTRGDASGFDSGNYGLAFVLCKSATAVNSGVGYAIVIGQGGATDAIRLASFSGGGDLNSEYTNIISAGDYGNEYISVRVTYNPTNDQWSLFAESNASAFPQSDPRNTATQIGSSTANTTYTATGNNLRYFGAYWNHSTGATENAVFDDVYAPNSAAASTPSLTIAANTNTVYGSVCTNASAVTKSFTITNSGTAASNVVVNSNNGQYVVSNLSSTSIAASGGTATFDVTYTPTTGSAGATITSFYDTSTNSGTIALSGTALSPVTQAVSTTAATLVTDVTARLNGNYTTAGVCPSTTTKGFVYSKQSENNDPLIGGANVTNTTVTLGSTGTYLLNISSLTPNTAYRFKAYVSDGTTVTYGTVESFTTEFYCAAGATDNGFEKLTNVTLASINNTSTSVAGGYQNFTGVSTNLLQGSTYPFSASFSGTSFVEDQVLVWIDFNKDGDFVDSGEQVLTTSAQLSPWTGNIFIPSNAPTGTTRMRVRLHDSSDTPNATPCGNSLYGEVEDYTVVITASYTLTYTAGAGGTISGTSPQTVASGDSGSAVTAVPNSGFQFVNWSDSSTSNPRTDTNVTQNISVTANFVADPSLSTSPTSFTGLTYVEGSGPSNESGTFSIIGSDLIPASGNITVTPSANIEVYDGATWQAIAFDVAYTGGTITTASIYKVRLKAGLATATYGSESVSLTNGTTNASLTVSGTVTSASAPSCPLSTTVSPSGDQIVCQGTATNVLTANITLAGSTGTPTLSYQWYYNSSDSNTVAGATLISGATNATYTPLSTSAEVGTRFYFVVGYATDNGCAQTNASQSLASNTVSVQVNATPDTPTISAGGPLAFCAGGSVLLTSSSTIGNNWSTGATTQSITASTSGNYTVTVTIDGCPSAASDVTTVTVTPLPTTPTISADGPTSFCAGGNVNLTSSVGDSYLWSTGATTATINVTTSGTYTVQVTTNGCQSASSLGTTVTVGSALVAGSVQPIVTGTEGPNLVISQVYGGGGNAGAPYLNDFIEIFNPKSTSQNLSGWSVQYASATGNTWAVTALTNFTLQPGQYYLIQQNSGGANGVALPTPNATANIAMAGAAGKVALVNSTTALSGTNPSGVTVVDLVGYGLTANGFQGSGPTPAPSNTTSVIRTNVCIDANSNSTEFLAGAPNPRNSSTPLAPCVTSSSTQAICSGATPTSISVTAATGSTGDYTYEWFSFNGSTTAPIGAVIPGDWTSVSAATNSLTFAPSAITSTTTYAVYVRAVGCGSGSWASGQRVVTVNALPTASITETDDSGTANDNTICSGASATLTASGGTSYSWNTDPIQTTAAISVSPTVETTYTVTVTNANGCSSTAQATIFVNPLPTQPTISAPTSSIYPGGSVALTSSVGTSYLWSNAATTQSTTVSPTTDTSYTVQVANANGCLSPASEPFLVSMYAFPTIDQFIEEAPPCDGATANFVLSNLYPNTFNTVYYAINGVAQTPIDLLDDSGPTGFGFFSIPVTEANNGQNIRVTAVQITGDAASLVSFDALETPGTTITVSVATLIISGPISPACGQTTVDLTSVVTSNSTVTYFSDSGYSIAVPDETSVSTAGTYYVRATTEANCTTEGTITVNAFKPNPIVAITGASSICAVTGTTTLSPTTGGTWISNDTNRATVTNAGVVSAGAVTGLVTFTFTDSTTGCSATTANVTVTTQPQWYLDADGDGYYTGSAVSSCTSPGAGYTTTVLGGGDCNDDPSAVNPLGVPSSAIHPNATEVCYNNIDDDCDGFFSESCPAVVVNMTPATTITNFSIALSAVAYTYPGASSLGYRFWIRNLTSGQIREVNMPTRFVTIPSDIRSYNTLYELRAAAIINGEIVPYAGNIITVISPSIQLVQLSATSCNSTLASIGSTISASPGPNALTYTFRIRLASDNSPTPTYGEVTTLGSRFVNSNSFIGMPLQYNTVYSVSVKYTFDNNDGLGVQESGWGAECTLTTPGIPVIGLSSPMCGSTLSSMNSTISANPALYAIQYRFRMRLSSSNPSLPESYSTSLPVNSRFTYMSALQQQFPLEYAKSYYVSVQYSITNNSVEQWSNYGPECLLSTPALPFATIVGDCEAGLTPASSSELIYSTTYAGASGYRFIIQDYNELSELTYDQYEDRVTNNFSLSMFSGLVPGEVYNLSVWVIMNGQPVDGGINPCQITIPLSGKAVIASPFSAKAYPNPFASNFLIDVTTENKSAVNIKVYDMVGRLVEEQSVQVTDMKTSPIGNRYPSGVYNVIITQENEVQTLRVVKR